MSEIEDPLLNNVISRCRVVSLDVFRGLSVLLMIVVDYGGSIFPIIAHSPWNGLHLADFVMPFFLFIVGVSIALANKRVSNKVDSTSKALLKAAKLFLLGIVLQGGYLHGTSSLTYGVDIQSIRWLGILQRISIGYSVAALCEIWIPCQKWRTINIYKSFYCRGWLTALSISAIYMGLLYGLHVPDWQFKLPSATSSFNSTNDIDIYTVKCDVRGDLGPACNAAGMIDRYILGISHLYTKPVYRNLKECNEDDSGISSPWCYAPFDPEGILSSLTAAVTCIIGVQYGHILTQVQDDKGRIQHWFLHSVSLFILGLFFSLTGVPLNKSLYSISYMLITSAAAGFTLCALYALVDICGYRRLSCGLEWMGVHSLNIFIILTSNIAVIAIQGFYWSDPQNNIIQWIVTRFVQT